MISTLAKTELTTSLQSEDTFSIRLSEVWDSIGYTRKDVTTYWKT